VCGDDIVFASRGLPVDGFETVVEFFGARKLPLAEDSPKDENSSDRGATMMIAIKVVLLVFATPDRGAGMDVSSAALAVAVRVNVGVTVLTGAGAFVKFSVGVGAAGLLDEEVEELEDEDEDEEEAVLEDDDAEEEEEAEEEAAVEEALVVDTEEVEEDEDVAEELAKVALEDEALETVGIAPAPATWPKSGRPRSGNGERFFIRRFMLRLVWSRLRRGTSWASVKERRRDK